MTANICRASKSFGVWASILRQMASASFQFPLFIACDARSNGDMLFVYFRFCFFTYRASYFSQSTLLAFSLSSLPSHCNVASHFSEQFTAPMACVARQPTYVFSYSNLRDKLAPTVLDDFTKQADFANAAPFGPGPREERLDCDRRLERDGAFPPTQLIRV
jgi:hypothetical protein